MGCGYEGCLRGNARDPARETKKVHGAAGQDLFAGLGTYFNRQRAVDQLLQEDSASCIYRSRACFNLLRLFNFPAFYLFDVFHVLHLELVERWAVLFCDAMATA